MSKIKTTQHLAKDKTARVDFRVPHTEEGLLWIKQARKWVNRDRYAELRSRPRGGSRRRWAHSCQRHDAKWFGIYLNEPDDIACKRRQAAWEQAEVDHSGCVDKYVHTIEVEKLKKDLQAARDDIRSNEAWCDEMRDQDTAALQAIAAESTKRLRRLHERLQFSYVQSIGAALAGLLLGVAAGMAL